MKNIFLNINIIGEKKNIMFIGNCNNPNAAYMPAWRGTTGNTLLGYGLGHPYTNHSSL